MFSRMTAFIAALSVSWLIAPSVPAGDSASLADVRALKVRLAPGDSTQFLVSFRVGDGLHINAEPPVELKIVAPESGVTAVGSPEQSRVPESGVLDLTSPVRQLFRLAPTLEDGPIDLTVTVSYFICSEADGWCRMRTDTSMVAIMVIRD
jgi:hypothetical protein